MDRRPSVQAATGGADNLPSVRARQAELRALYAERPEAATIHKLARTGPASGRDPFHVTVVPENLAAPDRPYAVEWLTGIDRAVGGLHDAPNPGEMLCGTLATCFDGTLRMIAALIGIALEEVAVQVSGSLDVRGALDIDHDVPVGFQAMRLEAKLRTTPETPSWMAQQLARAVERLCITLDTLRRGVPVEVVVDVDTADPRR